VPKFEGVVFPHMMVIKNAFSPRSSEAQNRVSKNILFKKLNKIEAELESRRQTMKQSKNRYLT